MQYLIGLILTFVCLMLLTQIIFFELARNKVKKSGNIDWYLNLNKPFHYNRVGYMAFVCVICYIISSPVSLFSVMGIVYFVIFLAVGVISDIIVQYLITKYGKLRCHREIEETLVLEKEVSELAKTVVEDYQYEESNKSYDEKIIFKEYYTPQSHIAHMSIDEGHFVKELNQYSEANFVVATYGNVDKTKENLIDMPVQVTKLTPSGQMPFKDEKMDIVMCMNSNYDKNEVLRVLKQGGYFLVNQYGTANMKEILHMFVPFGMKGSWDAYSCSQTLESVGFQIIDKFENYGTVRFFTLYSLYTYLLKNSPGLANIEKYKTFYMNVLKSIKEYSYYELTTHQFLVVAKKM